MRISDDLHRELAEEHSGLPSPQAIIGACGARVERALWPRDLRPEPRTNAHLPGESKHWTHSNRIFPAPYAAYAPQRCGERSRPAQSVKNVRGLVGRGPLRCSQRSGRRRAVTDVRRQSRAAHAIAVIKRTLLHHTRIHTAATTRASGTPTSAGSARRSDRIGRSISAAARTGRIAARIAAMERAAATTAGRGEERERNEEERETFHF